VTRADSRPALSRGAAFAVLAAVLWLLLFAAGAPSPLYVVYQAQWHFPAGVLTVVFALYTVPLLLALLLTGSLSDRIGRRPVVVASLALSMVAMALFIVAGSVEWLYAARVVQGLATGVATGALSAALIDLQPAGRTPLGALVNSVVPPAGLGTGALGTGLLVEFAPAPTRLVYVLLLIGFGAAILGTLLVPETVARSPAAGALRPQVGVPREVRGAFALGVPSLVGTWALSGLYPSLGPSLAAELLRSRSHLIGGLVVFALTGAAALASVVVRDVQPRRMTLAGAALLVAGVAVTLAGLGIGGTVPFFAGTVIAGLGFGPVFLGTFRTLSALAPAAGRAALIASIYVVSYLAFGLPAIAAGYATAAVGLRTTTYVYGIVVAALIALAAVGLATVTRRREPRAERQPRG
jgi:predicted MFS family arabinose efflux permease